MNWIMPLIFVTKRLLLILTQLWFVLIVSWLLFKDLVKKDPIRRQVLRVKGCLAGSKAENLLEQGDMVLAINKQPITCFYDIENACQELDKNNSTDGKLNMTIFRQVSQMICLILFSLFLKCFLGWLSC